MASRIPESGHNERKDSSVSNVSSANGGEPRGSHARRDGDGCLGEASGGDDDDDDDDNDDSGKVKVAANAAAPSGEEKKKRKKRKRTNRKKKSATADKVEEATKQSSPPRIPLSALFPSGHYPEGEVLLYDLAEGARPQGDTAESRHVFRQAYWADDNFLKNYRQAAEIHRQSRQWLQQSVKPGQTTLEIVTELENTVRALLGNAGLETGDCLKSGMGFPTGICLNNQVAHYTPHKSQRPVVLQQQDVMTIDFGVHINGWIVDSAFTMAFDPTYDNLLAAVKDATNTGIKTAGIDVRICDVSAAIEEVMESYEVEICGRTFPVKPVENLSAHNIKQYRIHGGKSIPFVKNIDQTKMEEGEVFAIETFGTTGSGETVDDAGVYGYGLHRNSPLNKQLPSVSAKRLHKTIRENFGTLVFNRNYLERLGVDKYHAGLKCLVDNDILEEYKPLKDIEGSYSAQFEHTLLLHDTHKEILSRGDDY